jgi:hypothetical protein
MSILHTLRMLLSVVAVSLVASNSYADAKAGPGGVAISTSQAATPKDPLKSFQSLVAGYTAFFSSSQKLLHIHRSSESPSGKLAAISQYIGKDLSYDVKKTDSLVSPFSAYIQLSLSSTRNSSCGTVTAYQQQVGWPDAAGALAHADSTTCFKPLFSDQEYWDRVRFQYSYQDDKWVLMQIVRLEFGTPEHAISAAIGRPGTSGPALRDPEAMAFNKPWADTLNPSQP